MMMSRILFASTSAMSWAVWMMKRRHERHHGHIAK